MARESQREAEGETHGGETRSTEARREAVNEAAHVTHYSVFAARSGGGRERADA